jgi:hypothetical protein
MTLVLKLPKIFPMMIALIRNNLYLNIYPLPFKSAHIQYKKYNFLLGK